VEIQECSNLLSFLAFSQVSNESLRSLSTLKKLEDIVMVGCLFIDDDGLQMLSAGNSLQSIDVSRCHHVTSQGLALLIDSQRFIQKINAGHSLHEIETCFLSKLSTIGETLTVLRLDGLEIFASNLQAIADSCKNLAEIGLSKCNGVTDDGIASLVVNCSYLRTTTSHVAIFLQMMPLLQSPRTVEWLNASGWSPALL
jgi:F-box/leucine-rich repeat protein 2/20